MNIQSDIYKYHHTFEREGGFSVLKDERGKLLKNLIKTGKSVLDIGCRDGALTKYFTEGNKVLGVDIDDQALKEAERLNIETQKVDLNGDWSEFKNRKFDVIVAGEILEHLYYPDQIVKKVTGFLNSYGTFVGSVPNAFSLKNRFRLLFGKKKYTSLNDPTHINHFHVNELREILQKHFSKVKILGLGKFKVLSRIAPGFFAFDLFFICQK